jgi:hypothetical protein
MPFPTPRLGSTAVGVARYLARTASSLAADVASAAVHTGEVVSGLVAGTEAAPGTVRLTVLILSDERGVPLLQPALLEPALARADEVLAAGADVRVRHVGTHVVTEPAPTAALNPRANKLLLLDEALGRTDFYHRQLREIPDTGAVTDVVGRPITAIVVRDIAGRTTGCSLGISADWVVVQAGLFDPARPHEYDETVLVHELGHALNLPHHPSPDNLMYFSSSPPDHMRGTRLNAVQRAVINANRHVVPGVRR